MAIYVFAVQQFSLTVASTLQSTVHIRAYLRNNMRVWSGCGFSRHVDTISRVATLTVRL